MRICSRCGMHLHKPDGSVDYKRRFCGSECKKEDLREKMRAKRLQAKGAAQGSVVSRNKAHSAPYQAVEGDW